MLVLTQFLLRLGFGLAFGTLLAPARLVTSGYFRNNLYVLLGLNVLAALMALGAPADTPLSVWPPVVGAIASYLGSACWLYEAPRPGKLSLAIVTAAMLAGAWIDATPSSATNSSAAAMLGWLDPLGEGLILGLTMAAMLLGHWYLNAPGMRLEPLRRLVALVALAIVVRAALSGAGLACELAAGTTPDLRWWLMLSLRWLAGIVGMIVVTWMTWQTLKIPNTQSATGILYVGVIATFLGELTGQLLSRESLFPL